MIGNNVVEFQSVILFVKIAFDCFPRYVFVFAYIYFVSRASLQYKKNMWKSLRLLLFNIYFSSQFPTNSLSLKWKAYAYREIKIIVTTMGARRKLIRGASKWCEQKIGCNHKRFLIIVQIAPIYYLYWGETLAGVHGPSQLTESLRPVPP